MGLLDYLQTGAKQLGKVADAQFPVGDIPLPGGYTLNDALHPFTDTRGAGQMLPNSLSLNDIGRSFQAMSPENMVNSHFDAIGGKEYGTGRELGSAERLTGLLPAAGAEGGGMVRPAAEAGSTVLGTFAGRNAKTANLQKLRKAERMETAGSDAEAIRQATDWQRGHDGEWKFEISDHDAEIRKDPKTGEETLHHPAFRRAYPDLHKNLKIERKLFADPNQEGAYDTRTNTMYLASKLTDPDAALSVTLHELQHPIQQLEGFSPGSWPNMPQIQVHAAGTVADGLASAQATRDAYADKLRDFVAAEQAAGSNLPPDQLARKFENDNLDLYFDDTQAEMKIRELKAPDAYDKAAFDAYHNTMGEYEAREVQARRTLKPDERRSKPPYQPGPDFIDPADLLDVRTMPGFTGTHGPVLGSSSRTNVPLAGRPSELGPRLDRSLLGPETLFRRRGLLD